MRFLFLKFFFRRNYDHKFLYIGSSKGAEVLSWCGGFGWSDRPDDSSKGRDIVLDPFGGSGSTLISCEKAGRQARLIELDPKYVDTIIMRWQEFNGGTAVLDSDGRSFEEIAASREAA